MTTNYFQTCKTLDEAKKEFYALAKIHHPDKGGDVAVMQEILNQFEKFTPETEKFKGEIDQWNSAEYATIIADLIRVPEIVVEIIGSFIWVSGNTKPYKDQIKSVTHGESYKSAQWHSKKLMWFFAPTGYRRFTSKVYSIDEIRNLYGSTVIKKNERGSIAA
jgi:hypothetical protein